MKKSRILGVLLAGIMAVTGVPYIAQPLAVSVSAASEKLAAPSSLTASYVGSNVARLTWSEVEGADGYRIYRYISSSGKYKELDSTKTLEYYVKGLNPTTKYKFRVAALKLVDNDFVPQTMSDPITVTTQGLSAPTSISVSLASTSVTLRWNIIYNADSYRVYKYSTKKGKFVTYKDVKEPTCTIDGLTEGKTYKFQIAPLVKINNKYKAQEKSSVIIASPVKSEEFRLPDFPSYGASVTEAIRAVGAVSYTVEDYSEGGTMYILGSNPSITGGDYTGLMINDDNKYYGATTVTSFAVPDSEVLATLRNKYGEPKVISDQNIDTYIWESKEDIKLAAFYSGAFIYAEVSYKYAPQEMIESIVKYLKDYKTASSDL